MPLPWLLIAAEKTPSLRTIAKVELGLRRKGDFYLVPISVAGTVPAWFILDTGSYLTSLTKRGYARLRAAIHGRSISTVSAKVGDFPLGTIDLRPDPSEFADSLDPQCDGVLGLDLLKKYRIGLDLNFKTVRFWKASQSVPEITHSWFGVQAPSWARMWPYGDGTYATRVWIDNIELPMCIDTGCIESYIDRGLAGSLQGARKQRSSKVHFYFGSTDVAYMQVGRYELGGIAILATGLLGATKVSHVPGLLGDDVLQHFRLLLDFPGERLFLARTAFVKVLPRLSSPNGPVVRLPNGVVIQNPLGAIVRVEPACTYENAQGYRVVKRPAGLIDLVPKGMNVPKYRPRPRYFNAPTIGGQLAWEDETAHVPSGVRYTVPPGWKVVSHRDGSKDLYPPNP